MDPVAALNEIAFRLERELAPTFKVKAFRRAAGALDGIPAGEVAERVADGRLRRTKGIGDTTFEVVREAVAGTVPAYLQKVRDRAEPVVAPTVAGAGGIRSALRGDLHTHS